MSTQSSRIIGRGRTDFARPLSFRFDGKRYQAQAGDTLASALLANGVFLVARSFKYHRPRGFYAAGRADPSALVELRHPGGVSEPNRFADEVPLYEGLEAWSQNRYPSLKRDLGAINNRLAPFLAAGFYYKTFMGPGARAWMRYEPWIRRAAGLGRLGEPPSHGDDDTSPAELAAFTDAADPATAAAAAHTASVASAAPERHESVNSFAEVLVIGSGPAGLAAAAAAAESNLRVVLADDGPDLGGSLLLEPSGSEAGRWRQEMLQRLRAAPNVRLLPRTSCLGAYDGGFFALLEQLRELGEAGAGETDEAEAAASLTPLTRLHRLRARQVVLATGAEERAFACDGNDLPGVALATAVRGWLNRCGVLPGRRILIAGTHDAAWEAAADLADAGLTVGAQITLLDARPGGATPLLQQALRSKGVTVHLGYAPLAIRPRRGSPRVGKVIAARLASTPGAPATPGATPGTSHDPFQEGDGVAEARKQITLPADLVCLSGGLDPDLRLWRQRGGPVVFDEALACFTPRQEGAPHDLKNWRVVGGAAGTFRRGAAIEEGWQAGLAARRCRPR